MSAKAHRWADRQTAAPRKLQALLHALAGFADANGIAHPSQDKIVPRIGWSKGTLKKWSNVGRALGLFSTKKRFNLRKGHCDAMIYTLCLDRVVTPEEVAGYPQGKSQELRFPYPRGKSQKKRFAPPSELRRSDICKSQKSDETAITCHPQIATGGKQEKKAAIEENLAQEGTPKLEKSAAGFAGDGASNDTPPAASETG